MTHLRKIMLEELQRRHYSEANHPAVILTVILTGLAADVLLHAVHATFAFRATDSLLARIDLTRSADDAPSSDNP